MFGEQGIVGHGKEVQGALPLTAFHRLCRSERNGVENGLRLSVGLVEFRRWHIVRPRGQGGSQTTTNIIGRLVAEIDRLTPTVTGAVFVQDDQTITKRQGGPVQSQCHGRIRNAEGETLPGSFHQRSALDGLQGGGIDQVIVVIACLAIVRCRPHLLWRQHTAIAIVKKNENLPRSLRRGDGKRPGEQKNQCRSYARSSKCRFHIVTL